MATKPLPCPTVLRQLLRYDSKTGKLYWRFRGEHWFTSKRAFRVWNACYAEGEALASYDADGYKHGNLLNRRTRAHRLIWAHVNGHWPKNDIDHINGIRDDNRISNLRDVTRATNLKNAQRRSDNTSGSVGVDFLKRFSKWRARIGVKHIGTFDTFEEAVEARKAAEVAYGYHPNHGREAAT